MASLIQGLSFSSGSVNNVPADNNCAVYYAQRADKARAMAQAARDPGIRDIHLSMANEYDRKVEQFTASIMRIRPQSVTDRR